MEEMLLQLGEGLLKSLGEKILSKIFGEKSPEEYFQEILDAIKEYLHVEIVSNDIVMIKGTLTGIISQMTIDYVNKKKSGAPKSELLAFLVPIQASMDQKIMGPLEVLTDVDQEKGNAQQSLLVYMVGGGMQLSVLQEMALNDPAVSNPAASQYATDIEQYATKYASRATTILAKIRTQRQQAISDVMCMGNVVSVAEETAAPEPEQPGWPGGVKDYTFYVQDKWVDQTVCQNTSTGSIWSPCSKTYDAYPKTVSCHAGYVSTQMSQFDSQWDGTSKLIAAWVNLQTNPLPSG